MWRPGFQIFSKLCVLSVLQAYSVKRTLMTVLGVPTASTVVSVWTGLGATAVDACLALLASDVKETSTSVSPTPVTPRAVWTASSSPTTTSVSAEAPLLVRPPEAFGHRLGSV